MGGKMGIIHIVDDQYDGTMPGVAEGALLTLKNGKPLVTLAAFGGATRDIAIALGLLPASAATPRGCQIDSYSETMKEFVDLGHFRLISVAF
jgi:hypothetical protein